MNKTKCPLMDDEEKLVVSKCVEALLKHGDYWYDPCRKSYFNYTQRFWREIPVEVFHKRLLMLLGDLATKRVRDEIVSSLTTRISTTSNSDIELPKGLINLENGVLEVNSGDLLPHSKDYYFFNAVPIEYDVSKQCPKWESFLDEVMLGKSDLIDLLQEMFGYCLIPGNWQQVAFILYGEGENGKSVLLEVLRNLLGISNTSALSLSDISSQFRRIELHNKYANICDESPTGKAIEADTFKNLVSGGVVVAEQKFKPAFSFYNLAKLIFSTNSVPHVKDHTHAFYRRLIVVPFDYRVSPEKKDKQLAQKLLEELPGILNWSIEGLRRLEEQKIFTEADGSLLAKDQFVREGDSVKSFLDDCCETEDSYEVYTSELYSSYREFCESNGQFPVAINEFGKRLTTHVRSISKFREGSGKRAWKYLGVKLTESYSHCYPSSPH